MVDDIRGDRVDSEVSKREIPARLAWKISFSKTFIRKCTDDYRRLRNLSGYLLGGLSCSLISTFLFIYKLTFYSKEIIFLFPLIFLLFI